MSIDVRYELQKMQRVKTAILNRSLTSTLLDIVASDREAFSGMRVLFASDNGGVPIQALGEGGNPNVPVASLFIGSGVFAFSDEIEKQMVKGVAPLTFPYFLLIDTNFLTELPGFFQKKESKHRTKVAETLNFIETRAGKGFDWSFATLENLREALKPNNPWPYEKVAAAKMFDAMMHDPRVKEKIARADRVPIEDYIPAAEDMWDAFLSNSEAWASIRRRDLMHCIVLCSLLECWKGKGVGEGLRTLVEFSLDNFDIMPLKELYFGWKALTGFNDVGSRLPIFNESSLRNPNDDSIGRASALAWDLYMFRHCETLMTEKKGSQFVIPIVTTLDGGLLDAVKSCPLRAIIINDKARRVEAIFDDELDFLVNLNAVLSDDIKAKISNPKRLARTKKISSHTLAVLIKELEGEVRALVKARSAANA